MSITEQQKKASICRKTEDVFVSTHKKSRTKLLETIQEDLNEIKEFSAVIDTLNGTASLMVKVRETKDRMDFLYENLRRFQSGLCKLQSVYAHANLTNAEELEKLCIDIMEKHNKPV